MPNINKVTLAGRLGADPEVRRLNNGKPVVSFSLATSERWRDKQSGDWKEKTEWHNVVIFNERYCNYVEKYGKKGMEAYVEGQMQTRKWQDQKGQDRYTTEVVVQAFRGDVQLDTKPGGNGKAKNNDADDRGRQDFGGDYDSSNFDRGELDDIPF